MKVARQTDGFELLENQKVFQHTFQMWQWCDALVALLTMSGLILTMVQYELDNINMANLSADDAKKEASAEIYDSPRWQHTSQITRWIVVGLSFASIIAYMFRRYYKEKWFRIFSAKKKTKGGTLINTYGERVYNTTKRNDLGFDRRRCSKMVAIDLLVLLVCPVPMFETIISHVYKIDKAPEDTIVVHQWLSDYILCFMLFRMYFVVRAGFNYNYLSDAYSKRLCRMHNFYPGFRFILKSIFVGNPEATVMSMFLLSNLVLSYVLRVFEIRYTQ